MSFTSFNLMHCRNQILSLWNRDVTRILPLAECGVSDTHSEHGSPRFSLIREVYAFLDQYVSLFIMVFSHQISVFGSAYFSETITFIWLAF